MIFQKFKLDNRKNLLSIRDIGGEGQVRGVGGTLIHFYKTESNIICVHYPKHIKFVFGNILTQFEGIGASGIQSGALEYLKKKRSSPDLGAVSPATEE